MMEINIYTKKDGVIVSGYTSEVREQDAKFFKENNIKVSLHEVGEGGYVVYADMDCNQESGTKPAVREPVASWGNSFKDAFRALRERCEAALAQTEKPLMRYGDGITLTGKMIEQLKEMDLCAEQTINIYEVHDGPDGAGVYAYFTEHPDEGYMFLGVVR